MPSLRAFPLFICTLASLVGCGKTGELASRVNLNDKAGPTTTTPGGGVPQSTATPTPSPVATGTAWYAGGSLSGGASFDTNHLLRATSAGTYTSAVVDAGDTKKWKTLRAASTRPVGMPLPDNRGADGSTFTSGRINTGALNIVSLFHLSSPGFGADASGAAHNGVALSNPSAANGLFGRGAMHASGGYVRVPAAGSITGAGPFAVSVWFRTSAQTGTIYAQRDPNAGLDGEWSLGLNDAVPNGPAGIPGQLTFWMWAGNGPASVQSVGNGWADGQWHHVVATRDVVAARAVMTLYIDGKLNAQNANETVITARPLTIGIGSEALARDPFDGDLQEVAVFGSALTAATAKDLYLRGNGGIKFQVRACATSSCGDATFLGPDGSSSSFFTSLENALDSLNLAGRYFQFKISLSPVLDEVPVITNVTLETDPN